MALSATAKLTLSAIQTLVSDLGTSTFPLNFSQSLSLSDGTGASQADRMFTDTRTLAASATEDLDLSGSLTNSFGTTVTFAKIKMLIVLADSGNTNNVNVTRPASNGVPWALAAGDGVAVAPGEFKLLLCRGDATAIPVTAGTGDLITFTNSAGSTSVTYSVIIIGTSA